MTATSHPGLPLEGHADHLQKRSYRRETFRPSRFLIEPIKAPFKQLRFPAPMRFPRIRAGAVWRSPRLNDDFRRFFAKEFPSHSTGQCSCRAEPRVPATFESVAIHDRIFLEEGTQARYYSNRLSRRPPLPCILTPAPRILLAFSRIVTYP